MNSAEVTDIPVEIGRDAARDAAVRELSDPAYRDAEPSTLTRVLRWLLDLLDRLLGGAASLIPGGFVGLLVLIALVVAVIVVIRLRVGKLARTARTAVFAGRRLTAADHRRAAEAAEAKGDLAEAVRERFRAIARGLEERGVLDERSGRTVDEVARAAGAELPDHANALRSAAQLFDDVWYGGREATVDEYRRLSDLDLALDGARR
ncbi:DUF4129 domain-containing protein [Kibdelosporangium persicum]|uniref:Cyclic nucleotide-binding domain-containing protein n=1 Tax=Kibdelosporangium persicum TaxID=2698649 RepID=A0ABX2F6R5_9PSEU|nr:DUF4129 domain-containing protein [Kibdelosporangium persicum]NRN66650.1 Cyclic nucleotide-binding domain-containing protein [Kibdelosporangium persicum]